MNDSVASNNLDRAVAEVAALRERMSEQFHFAEELLKIHPDHATAWRPLIDRARAHFDQAAVVGSLDSLSQAVASTEAILVPIGKVAKTYTIHCVGHAHIDMNWMWSWPETVAIANDTFTTALMLMDEFPDFHLTQSQGAVYELIRRHNPELFDRIKQRIREGRWEVAAATWVEGDKNISSGESLAHHGLVTRQFMRDHFGLSPEDVPFQWEPDTFGHAHSIPMIASQFGVKCYYLCRPGEQPTPPIFWWKSPDGSRILVHRETDWYNNLIAPHLVGKMLAFSQTTGLRDWMCVYGVGDHGGGPTRRDLRRAMTFDTWPIYPHFRFATARAYFDDLLKDPERFPTLDRELNFEFAGCYTSQSAIKKANRAGENLLVEAESAAALAHAAIERPVPHERLREAWQDVLFGQFHDILPGSGVRATRDYNQGLFQKISADAGMVKTNALRAIAAAVDTTLGRTPTPSQVDKTGALPGTGAGGGAGRITPVTGVNGAGQSPETPRISSAGHVAEGPRPVVIFNPTAWPREEVVTVSVWEGDGDYSGKKINARRFIVRTPDGQTRPTQRMASGGYWGHEFVDLAFTASVGPLAYTTYSIEEAPPLPPSVPAGFPGLPPASTEISIAPAVPARVTVETEGGWKVNNPAGRLTLENEHLLVEFDRATGGIKRLLDKATDTDLAVASDPLGLLEYVLERPHPMSSWILADPEKRIFPLTVQSLNPGANGPYHASVNATVRVEQSRFEIVYSLESGRRALDIDIRATWLERGGPDIGTPKLLIRFPLHLDQPSARYEIPFGVIRRDQTDGREMPALRWVDVDGTLSGAAEGSFAGFALLNDCKHGHSLTGSVLRQTLIRSSYDPDPLPEMGEHRVRLAIVPHAGQASAADLIRWGTAHNQPLICVNSTVHGGNLPASVDSVLASLTDGVLITHLKPADDGNGLIARLQETAGQKGNASIRFNPDILGRITSATAVDLLERPVGADAALAIKANEVSVPITANGIASVRLSQ